MTKRIFLAIVAVTVCVLIAGVGLISAAIYGHTTQTQHDQMAMDAALVAQGVEELGAAYFEGLSLGQTRVTWIARDGKVLYDTDADAAVLESHLDREEVLEALSGGTGKSYRYSSTLMERYFYYALRLSDGSVIRFSVRQNSWLTALAELSAPIFAVLVFGALLALFLASRLSKKIVEPLNRLDPEDPMGTKAYPEVRPLLEKLQYQQEALQLQEDRLRRKQREFDSVTANMREGLVLLGTDAVVLSSNPAAVRILGQAAAAGEHILSSNYAPVIAPLLKNDSADRQLRTNLHQDGRIYRLGVTAVYSGEVLTGRVLLVFDVTEREMAEQMRREFSANVSHELKTPLHTISGYSELMAAGIVAQQDVPGFAESIHSEAMRMVRLVEDILKLSQLDEGSQALAWEPVDLYARARNVMAELEAGAKETGVSMILTGYPVVISAVTQLVDSILINLVGNAIKYNVPDGRVEIQVTKTGQTAVLTVVDTGIGIPKEDQNRIFERFYRVDKSRSKAVGGTGLGLSIVKHAAKTLGADIRLESAPNAGTKVTVSFPSGIVTE